MKFIVLVTLMVLATAFATPTVDETRFIFNNWVKQHGKTYSSVDEVIRRFEIFADNLAVVNQHNEEAAKGMHTYTLGMNKLADLTVEEYRSMYLGYRASNTTRTYAHLPASEEVADGVDWRTKGIVTPVKDQGQCGSCWSFSSTGSMEGAHAQATGKLVSLSEQDLVDCVQGGSFTCTTGGEMQAAFQYVITNKGIESEAAYPYCTCSGNSCKYSQSKSVATFSSYKNVQQGSESALLTAVNSRVVSIAIDASSQKFQLYSSGVYNNPFCSSTQLDHGVLIVGYGTSNGADYWIVKNSWSAQWGLQGYIWMSRNKNNQCGVATDACYPLA